MERFWFAGILTLYMITSMPLLAQDLPIFDAHIHYSQADWSVYSPEAALTSFDNLILHTWVTSQWSRLPDIQTGIHMWLMQLPLVVADRIAFKFAARLVGMP